MAGARLWLLLALLAGHGARPGRAGLCQHGELREVWGGGTKCCPRCTWKAGNPAPCKEAPDPDCKCPPGHGCSGEPCQFCSRVPRCPPGSEPGRIGSVNFRFECKPCGNGTYSSSRSSWCRNWTDCESSGFFTLREGNSTHNSLCSMPVRALEPARRALELPCSSVLAALVAVAVLALLLLLLLLLLLHHCACSPRTEPRPRPGDPAAPFPRLRPPQRPAPGEESYSIQFPEEEHGDQGDEKLSALSLKAFGELR